MEEAVVGSGKVERQAVKHVFTVVAGQSRRIPSRVGNVLIFLVTWFAKAVDHVIDGRFPSLPPLQA